MFNKERLPPKDEELQVYTSDKNLATPTQNRQVQFLIENICIRKSIYVKSPKAIDDNITIAVQRKESRLQIRSQRVASTKQIHTKQLATEKKAVEKEISDQEMENDSSESNRLNLRP